MHMCHRVHHDTNDGKQNDEGTHPMTMEVYLFQSMNPAALPLYTTCSHYLMANLYSESFQQQPSYSENVEQKHILLACEGRNKNKVLNKKTNIMVTQ